ncbi:MAG: DUF4391 domain-containing protein [Labilibaculum sp.]|nr:DUF4391 domain-containing protein [Labilibaculum sp.]MBI9060151.1 DUF4391 domain-containing protein [Labilibaculum sp.]
MELKLPGNAFVNKFIAKSKFYERATLSTKLQNEFIRKIQKITWKYKLAEETIGIPKTENVTEIQIFEIELKEQIIPKNVLKIIDKSIPYPILYIFTYKDNFAYGITLKDNTNAQNYYFSEWDENIEFDFVGIDLEKVYQKLIKSFIKNESKTKDKFEDIIKTDSEIKQLEKDIFSLESKIRKEKQFNRKIELNKVLLEKKQQLINISDES